MNIQNELKKLKDDKYKEFISSLTKTVDKKNIIGVRLPVLRKFAKRIKETKEANIFINTLPHKYYEENMLHAFLLMEIKDFDICLNEVNKFLPYIDNWAVCDSLRPKAFKKNKNKLFKEVKKWIKSKDIYTCRYGIEILMSLYLDDDFKEEYLKLPCIVNSNDYYVQMMQAWFYATALVKRWDETILYLENNKLDKWIHNKTIQKAIESYRIIDKQKAYLKTLKRS